MLLRYSRRVFHRPLSSTAAATGELVKRAGGRLAGFSFLIELTGLQGRQALPGDVPCQALFGYS